MSRTLHLVGDPDADALLTDNPFALLVGMLLDQQIPMEVAFAGPHKLVARMGELTPATVAGTDPQEFIALCAQAPAVHRFPTSMGQRVHDLAVALCEGWDGDTQSVWTRDEPDGAEVLRRLKALPGFGEQKARIFLALLGKQYGLTAPGWQEAAGDYGRPEARRSIADVVDATTMAEVRTWKKEQKAAAKAAKAAKAPSA